VEAVLLLLEAVAATADIFVGFRRGVKGGAMEGRHALPTGEWLVQVQAVPCTPRRAEDGH
jgi:hypothetical protein